MTELPLEPSEQPGTDEYEELRQQRERRYLIRRFDQLDNEHDRYLCKRS